MEDSSSSSRRSVKNFVLKKRQNFVWLNSTSDLARLMRAIPLTPTIKALDEQMKAVLDRLHEVEEASRLQITVLLKAFEEMVQRMGVRGTLGIVSQCTLFGKDAYDPSTGKSNPEAVQRCIDGRIGKSPKCCKVTYRQP